MNILRAVPWLALVAATVAFSGCQAPQPAGRWLVSPEEAEALESAPLNPELNLASRGAGDEDVVVLIRTDGPELEFVQPSNETPTVVSPVDLVVRFRPKSSPPDLESLRVRVCKKTFLGCFGDKDVTGLLEEFASAEGITASGIMIPKGTFHVRFEIADTMGGRTIGEVRVKIER